MKLRHGIELPGVLVVGKSPGPATSIVLTLTAPTMPPDLTAPWASIPGPYFLHVNFNELGNYPHAGILLRNAAGQESVVPYTSWTEVAGVYTFVIPGYNIAYTHLAGEYAAVYNSAKLRGACADAAVAQELWFQNRNLRIKNYNDTYFDISPCTEILPYALNPWDGVFNRKSSSIFTGAVSYSWVFDPYPIMCSASGGYFASAVLTMNLYAYTHSSYCYTPLGMRWLLAFQWRGGSNPRGWKGYKACDSSDPCGVYNRFVAPCQGCAAGPATIELEVAP